MNNYEIKENYGRKLFRETFPTFLDFDYKESNLSDYKDASFILKDKHFAVEIKLRRDLSSTYSSMMLEKKKYNNIFDDTTIDYLFYINFYADGYCRYYIVKRDEILPISNYYCQKNDYSTNNYTDKIIYNISNDLTKIKQFKINEKEYNQILSKS